MIIQLIPKYVEATRSNHTYRIIRSFIIDGHEVAWVEMTYYLHDDTDRLLPQKEYRVMCDCDFTEGIGWNLTETGQIFTVHGKDASACTIRPLVMAKRHEELRTHLEKVIGKPENPSERETILFAVKAIEVLAGFAQHHIMIEEGSGAHFWGGYFYLQTINKILGVDWPHIHMAMAVLYRMKKLNLNGMVVVPYTEPLPATWSQLDRMEVDEYVLTRSIPTHDRMPHTWKLAIYDKSSDTLLAESELHIDQPLEFGVDQDDLAQSETKLDEMLADLKNQTA